MGSGNKRRRQYGTGSLYRRASDGLWIGTVEAGWTASGTRRRVQVSARTEAECRRRLRERQRQIATEGPPVAGSARTTVMAWSQEWLERHAHEVRPNTLRADRGAVAKWIVPTVGARRLESLTPADVRAVHQAVVTAGRTTTTARHAHSVLVKMLRAAVADGHQVPPRVLAVKAPPVAVNDRTAIPLDQALAVLEAAGTDPDAPRWVAALLQGMRQGEVLGLTWDRVDLVGQTLDVSWQLDTLPYRDRYAGTFAVPPGMDVRHLEGAWHLTPTKTARGTRLVPMVPWMVAALARWRDIAPGSPHGLVWPRPDGRPRSERADRAAWDALQAVAGVAHPSGRPWTLHEARHTAATLLLETGVDPEVARAIMGHSSVVTTRGYQHVSTELARKALDGVAARLRLTPGSVPTG